MKTKKGFSLVELLIVIGIIAVLGGVMLTQFSSSTESALATGCLNNMRSLCNAVLAQASKDSYYPGAGPYKYLELDQDSEDFNKVLANQGWLGTMPTVSCYHEPSDDGEAQRDAIEKGSIWRAMNGARSAYVCPSHAKHCKRGNRPTPRWSYAMNSYFGWDCGKAFAGRDGGLRKYGSGSFAFKFSSSTLKRTADKVLLFAEIPFMSNGVQEPEFETGASSANDGVLQYAADGGDEKYNKSAEQGGVAPEAIGFNHKSGQNYSAHVAFADGHCVKLMLPRGNISEEDLQRLTSWLCTGHEYTFDGSRYEKVEE